MVLRVEDTDRTRLVPGAAEEMARLLRWAGVEYDEGPDRPGAYGPYVQSERLPVYREHAGRLLEGGHAYRCFCPPERLEGLREVQQRRGLPSVYDRLCDRLPEGEGEARARSGEPHVVRLRMPPGESVLRDAVKGEVRFPHRTVDDQVLMKSDGFPTYHLASVVDDGLMRITHVIRGDEWLPSTVKHLVLYGALGWEPPVFAHLPLLLDETRAKLSKRHGHASVERFRDDGFLPEAVRNFVALLGWNPGDTREVFAGDELERAFTLDRVQRHAAVVDPRRLEWLNGQHLRLALDGAGGAGGEERVLGLLRPRARAAYPDAPGELLGDAHLLRVARALRGKASRVDEIVEFARPYLGGDIDYGSAAAAKFRGRAWRGGESRAAAAGLADELERAQGGAPGDMPEDDAVASIERAAASAGVAKGRAMAVARYLLTGSSVGPSIGTVVSTLGARPAAARIRRALELEAHGGASK